MTLNDPGKPRFVFLGTPDFAATLLQGLLQEKVATCVGVFTMPDKARGRGREVSETPVATVARGAGIPCFKFPKVSTDEGLQAIKGLAPDIALIVAFGQLIKEPFFKTPPLGTYNLHFSLLPRWRGASPVASAILAGDPESGVTLQRINAGLDTGDIAARESFSIAGLNAPEVFEKSLQVSLPLITQFLSRLPESTQHLTPQNHGEATHCGKFHKDSGQILPSSTTVDVLRKLRAFNPWPGVFLFSKARYRISQVGEGRQPDGRRPGLYRAGKKDLDLVLADGVLPVTRIQKEGSKEMDTPAFLNGCPVDFMAFIESPKT